MEKLTEKEMQLLLGGASSNGRPGNAAIVRIRGLGSVQPLYVVDGKPITEALIVVGA
ncbi:TonB-dependent receptor plug domain-containing protein [uncultured Dokdonia sp.]|uniref:TonB-dependent receptor plug domain-containing protein n=1 Tax=uncultured Dokdonia sp. TaxID=575653 RepID=UPI0026109EAE|nr:TonB-dependent receptor plug domain-containing protein [uncultured Dokdonia sp.]